MLHCFRDFERMGIFKLGSGVDTSHYFEGVNTGKLAFLTQVAIFLNQIIYKRWELWADCYFNMFYHTQIWKV